MPAAPDDWRRMGQERYLTGVDLEWRSYAPSNPEGQKAWKPLSRGVVVESLTATLLPEDDWEEVESSHVWDHDHCMFCWVTFEEHAKVSARPPTDRRVVTEGYLVRESGAESREWIREECFEDFKDEFRWPVTSTGEEDSSA